MNHLKRIFASLILALSACLLFAAEGDWWEGLPIRFRYSGLQNVSQERLDSLLSTYVGVPFSDDVFQEISNLLYLEDWMFYFEAEADTDENDVFYINLDIHENPYVNSVVITGNNKVKNRALMDAQDISVGSFFNPVDINNSVASIISYYLSKGYRDVKVEGDYEEDADKNQVSVSFNIVEGKQYKIRDIYFEGNTGANEKELNKLLSSEKKSFFHSGNFLESNIDTDKAQIASYYASIGYPDAKVVNVLVEPTGEETEDVIYVNLTFIIEEGDLWRIGSIEVEGNTVFSNKQIDDEITVKSGDVYDAETLSQMINNISTLYWDEGYIRAFVNPIETRDEENKTISYDIDIEEGAQSVVDEVVLTGLTKTKPYVFERELTIHVGDIFSRAQYIQSQQNLMNTGLLTSVRAQIYPSSSDNGVIVEFIIEEGNQMELQFGATFGGNVDGFPISGFLQWSDKNIFGTARNLSISTTLSPSTQQVGLSLSDNWVGDKRWSNGISLTVSRNARTGALQQGLGSRPYNGRDYERVTYPLGYANANDWYNLEITPSSAYLMNYDYWSISVGYNTGYTFVWLPGSLTISGGVTVGLNHAIYDDGNYTPYEYLIQQYRERWQFSNRLSLGITWDGRDLIMNTTRGYLFSLNYTYAGGFLFGLSNYNRLSFSAAGYHSLYSYQDDEDRTKALVLSLTSSVSLMLPQFWYNTDPISDGRGWGWYEPQYGATKYEMLYIDGMNIGRGFSVVYDLAFMWHTQLELTYPIVYQMLAVEAFASATGVTNTLNELNNFNNIDWYFAMGLGLKLQIPGFPLGLYIVKNATIIENNPQWVNGFILPGSLGLNLVLAISTSLY